MFNIINPEKFNKLYTNKILWVVSIFSKITQRRPNKYFEQNKLTYLDNTEDKCL